ncbi:hypothetical protein COCCADRAFT_6539 [Bipolaris zeicola 26-R-13]|uniref:Chromo domain-containing protein n=1 Tax=Cochliobolus carbonum (strain 26-R-13) TaxID=930089 RepID=W6Y1U9_COCC2|nr:uncharacterized protein COCCADRAFT_6539 [Bipolaris zeicola 26-R-13]EUC31605.1 hypothetical protein COCCADRAFT_6539 [Bipolaris zeicola 26-R-13]
MALRVSRGGRGRRRGRGKTQPWEWESYKPSPEIYDQLWRIRKEPAVVTAQPSDDCPIPHTQTRILDRRQTEGAVVRNYYVVQITRTGDGEEQKVTEYVDLSCILHYVSSAELERFENEQFRLEAEAEALAVQSEIDELARRQLEKNARGAKTTRVGSRMLSGLGLPSDVPMRARGRPPGRRGRGRGRGRGLTMRHDDLGEQFGDSTVFLDQVAQDISPVIPETDDEEDQDSDARTQPSPGLMRSAFFANSALLLSPVTRRLSIPITYDTQDDEAEDLPTPIAQQGHGLDENQHRIKRLRLSNPDSDHDTSALSPPQIPTEAFSAALFSDRSSAVDANSSPVVIEDTAPIPPSDLPALGSPMFGSDSDSDSSISAYAPPASANPTRSSPSVHKDGLNSDTIHMTMDATMVDEPSKADGENDEAADEYVVEAIEEHYHDGNKTYYLVKWEGYEDSRDWLAEEDLQGAREVVAEYHAKIRRREEKKPVARKGMFFK